MFMALSTCFWRDDRLHEKMRSIIVERLRTFPAKYKQNNDYCLKMSCCGIRGSFIELKAISDLTLSRIEIYTTESGIIPANCIEPSHSIQTVRLWLKNENNCAALISNHYFNRFE